MFGSRLPDGEPDRRLGGGVPGSLLPRKSAGCVPLHSDQRGKRVSIHAALLHNKRAGQELLQRFRITREMPAYPCCVRWCGGSYQFNFRGGMGDYTASRDLGLLFALPQFAALDASQRLLKLLGRQQSAKARVFAKNEFQLGESGFQLRRARADNLGAQLLNPGFKTRKRHGGRMPRGSDSLR